jgi:tRNA(adenine34) deaminase
MQHALALAQHAQQQGEVPVGAIIVLADRIIAQGWNQPIQGVDPTAHAEIVALRAAAKTLQNYRLMNTTLYVTLEPCAMCLGAIMHARVKRIVYGALDPKSGALGGACNLHQDFSWQHKLTYTGGVLEQECKHILQDFFQARR